MKLSRLSDFFFLCDPLLHPLPIPPLLCNILKSAKLFALFSIPIATIYIGRDPFLKQTQASETMQFIPVIRISCI